MILNRIEYLILLSLIVGTGYPIGRGMIKTIADEMNDIDPLTAAFYTLLAAVYVIMFLWTTVNLLGLIVFGPALP
jgi:phosphate/sulfate permease